MRCVIARVLPVPAPASTRTGPRSAVATSRCSGSSAASRSSADIRNALLAGGVAVGEATLDARTDNAMTGQFTMFKTSWCGYCHRLASQLDREGITYDVVDIERTPDAAEIVMTANGGNQTVPTLLYPDGTTQTNPSVKQVKEKLAAL